MSNAEIQNDFFFTLFFTKCLFKAKHFRNDEFHEFQLSDNFIIKFFHVKYSCNR